MCTPTQDSHLRSNSYPSRAVNHVECLRHIEIIKPSKKAPGSCLIVVTVTQMLRKRALRAWTGVTHHIVARTSNTGHRLAEARLQKQIVFIVASSGRIVVGAPNEECNINSPASVRFRWPVWPQANDAVRRPEGLSAATIGRFLKSIRLNV